MPFDEVFSLRDPDTDLVLHGACAQALAGDLHTSPMNNKVGIATSNGDRLRFMMHTGLLKDDRQRPIGLIATMRLLQAERDEHEQRLTQYHKMDAIGQLTGGIAHDFNNMLAGIMGVPNYCAILLIWMSRVKDWSVPSLRQVAGLVI